MNYLGVTSSGYVFMHVGKVPPGPGEEVVILCHLTRINAWQDTGKLVRLVEGKFRPASHIDVHRLTMLEVMEN